MTFRRALEWLLGWLIAIFRLALEWLPGRVKMEDGQGQMKRCRRSEDAAPDNPETSRGMDVNREDRLNESMNDDPILQSNHKIFLSHSGAQKDFVEQLCGDLERHHHFPFFDRRSSSLPKGERFPELILKAAQQCQMAVVVVSKEYFMSKWPMIELHAFVQARLKSNTKLKILPLFYELSVQEFGNERRRDQWFSKWEDWAKIDSRININEWKDSLKVMASFNGIEYNPDATKVEAYREDIVANICKEVPVDIKWDDSHVQGRSILCQGIRDRIQQIQPSQKCKVCLIGFYGVGGIGKTTISKTLCNELYQEFEGKVSHIEFDLKIGSQHSEVLLKKVLKDLTNTSQELLQQFSEGECRYILRKGLCKQRTFLAIDNVWDDSESIEQVKMYLQAQYHDGSVVMVTSRSLKTLTYLGINGSHCFEMPELEHEDAKNLFLYHAAYGIKFSDPDDKGAIEECVAICYFQKGESEGSHYLPLALKALGVQMGCVGNEPSLWVKTLPEMRDFNHLKEEQNPVFNILRSSFDRLRPTEQSLFMDVVVYTPNLIFENKLDLIEWLSLVYNQDVKEIGSRLQRLKERGLLEDVDMTSQRSISVHDLYREFAKLESEGKLNESADFKKRRWVYYEDSSPTELEMTPSHTCWHKLIRVGIEESRANDDHDLESLEGIEWRFCSNVVVLRLEGLKELRGDLNLKGLKCLRSLEIIDIFALDSLDGLQDLNNLTYFRWTNLYNYDDNMRTRMGQLPASLKVVKLSLGFFLRPDAFDRCTKLWKLALYGCRVENLDFSNCKSLQSVSLQSLHMLETLSGLAAGSTSTLQSLQIWTCKELVGYPELGDLVGLQLLYLHGNSKFMELPDLQKLTRLQVFNMTDMKIEEVPGLGRLRQLRELQCRNLALCIKLPNLSACEQLQAVDFSANDGLSSLDGVLEELAALRCLDLSLCASLFRLPDLSGLRSLEELDLRGSGIEIGEEDVCMLATLPLLHPVQIGRRYMFGYLRLDVARRKILKWVKESYQTRTSGDAWVAWTRWEERDLDMLPIKAQAIPSWAEN